MPLTVRKFNAQVKDPTTGDMIPAGLLSSDSLQAIEAAESAAITEIQQKGAQTKADIPDDYTELSESVGELKTHVDDIAARSDTVNFSTADYRNGMILQTGKWGSNSAYSSYYFSVDAGEYKRILITANANANALVGLLKNSTLANNTTPNYCDGITNRITVNAGTSEEIEIPDDCTYILITKASTSSNTDYTPASTIFSGYKTVPLVDDSLTISGDAADAATTGAYVRGIVGTNLFDGALNGNGGVRWETGEMYSSPSFKRTNFIDVSEHSRIVYKRMTTSKNIDVIGMAFYSSDSADSYISGQQIISNYYTSGSILQTITVPEGANYARFTWTDDRGEFVWYDADEYEASVVYELNHKIETVSSFAYPPVTGRQSLYLAETPTDATFNYAPVADGGTSYADIYDRYDALCTAYPKWLRRGEDLGNDSENYPIAHYTLRMYDPIVGLGASWTKWTGTGTAPDNLWTDETVYRRALLSAGVHGGEKPGVLALYYLVKDILASSDDWAVFLRSNFILEIVPIICPGNFNANRRNNANDVNVNRDYVNQNTAEAQAMTAFIDTIKSDLFAAIDFHTTHGKYGYLATPRGNPEKKIMMTLANQTAASCVSNWDSVTTALDISSDFYPYVYANLSTNVGTLPYYMVVSEITNRAFTLEMPSGYGNNNFTTEKAVAASKIGMDLGCNLLQTLMAM